MGLLENCWRSLVPRLGGSCWKTVDNHLYQRTGKEFSRNITPPPPPPGRSTMLDTMVQESRIILTNLNQFKNSTSIGGWGGSRYAPFKMDIALRKPLKRKMLSKVHCRERLWKNRYFLFQRFVQFYALYTKQTVLLYIHIMPTITNFNLTNHRPRTTPISKLHYAHAL